MTDTVPAAILEREAQLQAERERLAKKREPAPRTVGADVTAQLERHRPRRLLTDAEARARDIVRTQRDEREQRLERLRTSGITSHLGRDEKGVADVTRIVRGGLEAREALVLVQKFANPGRLTPPRWLILAGSTGVGKSVALGWLLARDGGRYVTVHELVEMHGALARGLAPATVDEVHARLARLVEARVLVLDELGQELSAPMLRAALHWLVEARASVPQADRYTVIASNLDASTLRDRFRSGTYDARTESRLRPLLWRQSDGSGIWELADKRDGRGEPI